MQTEAQKKAKAKYDKGNTKQIILKLNLKTDKDILDLLQSVGNKQGYIKDLIRKDICYKCKYNDWCSMDGYDKDCLTCKYAEE